MPAPSWEDLGVFFDTDDQGGFATVAEFTPGDGVKRKINVIYDGPYRRTDMPAGGYYDGAGSVILARDSDVVGLVRRGLLTVHGTVYEVKDVMPDGTGLTEISLTKYTGKRAPAGDLY
ncbi:hypothetical protein AB4P17_09960 [Escherichia coli]|uniref:head-tail joining protein n=1 Tax=Escherichia coli TaxID=562 RepID=UPI0034C5F827